jgi:putative Holliday junction resolvase
MFLAIDFGKKRIGLALGEVIPKGAGVIDGTKSRQVVFDQIAKICLDNEVTKIIIGLPFLGSGDEGSLVKETREFGQSLSKELFIPVDYEEEQYTSSEAERILSENNVKYDRKEGKVDEMAAVLILEQYLNNKK